MSFETDCRCATFKKKVVRQLLFILLIFLTGCKDQMKKADPTIDKPTEAQIFQVPDSTYVILQYNKDWYWMFKDVKPTTLSESELAEIEIIIDRAVKENNARQLDALEKHNKEYPDNEWTETRFELETKGFKRQYIPVINSDGQKEVWINFFCDDWGNANWKSDIIIVSDGGNCYFNLKVNLETKSYSELSINGYA